MNWCLNDELNPGYSAIQTLQLSHIIIQEQRSRNGFFCGFCLNSDQCEIGPALGKVEELIDNFLNVKLDLGYCAKQALQSCREIIQTQNGCCCGLFQTFLSEWKA